MNGVINRNCEYDFFVYLLKLAFWKQREFRE